MTGLRVLRFAPPVDIGLLFLRLAGSFMLFHVHGWPKVLHYGEELTRIEDPFGLGPQLTLLCAIFAEVVCPVLIAAGLFTRLACLPIVFLLLVSMLAVHPDWSIAEGQFGWLLSIIFCAIALCGPGKWSFDAVMEKRLSASIG
jgi:putative oxidoreductase